MTTFQYRTHSIKAGNTLYALKSAKVNLDDFANQTVTLNSVRTTFNLADSFLIQPGQYTAKYSGGGISGLDDGKRIKITVTD